MTATTNAKRANTRLFITFLICIVGALIVAPSAMAEDTTSDAEQAVADAQYVIRTYYNDLPENIDDYCVFYAHSYSISNSSLVDEGIKTLVYKKSDVTVGTYYPQYSNILGWFQFGGTSQTYVNLSSSFLFAGTSGTHFYFGTEENFADRPSSLWYFGSYTYWTSTPYVINGTLLTSEVNIGKATINPITYLYNEFVPFPPIETTDQTYSNAMLQEFLHENNITVDNTTAWIIRSNGNALEIPISYDVPSNYNGDFYLKQTQATPYLDRFHLVCLNPDYDVNTYRGSQVCIFYPFECTKLKLYALQDINTDTFSIDFWDNLPSGSPVSANWISSTPSNYIFESVSYKGRLLVTELEQNSEYPVYISWEMSTNWLAPIPEFNDILVGIDITVTDENGNETISRNTSNYTNFVNNYNQKAITGLTGSITGRTSFSGDWRGQNVNTSIDYNNNWTMPTDSNIQSLFSRVFTMGNGYVTTAALGVLAIAFCAYVLYGKH